MPEQQQVHPAVMIATNLCQTILIAFAAFGVKPTSPMIVSNAELEIEIRPARLIQPANSSMIPKTNGG